MVVVQGTKSSGSMLPPRLLSQLSDTDVIDTLLKPSVTAHPSTALSLEAAAGRASGTARRFRMWVVRVMLGEEGEN